MKTVSIANEFSLYPMGRDEKDGPDHGQLFFNKFILPNLEKKIEITIIFDGVLSFGSSFLDEAFYEMPKKYKFSRKFVESMMSIQAQGAEYRFYEQMAKSFMGKLSK